MDGREKREERRGHSKGIRAWPRRTILGWEQVQGIDNGSDNGSDNTLRNVVRRYAMFMDAEMMGMVLGWRRGDTVVLDSQAVVARTINMEYPKPWIEGRQA